MTLDEIVLQHELLVEAICSGNTSLAERIAKEHNTDGKTFVEHLKRLESQAPA